MLQGICLHGPGSGSARFWLLVFRSQGQTQSLPVHLLFSVFRLTWPVPGPDSAHQVLALVDRTDICPLSSSQPRQLGPAENLAPRSWFIQTCKLLFLFLRWERLCVGVWANCSTQHVLNRPRAGALPSPTPPASSLPLCLPLCCQVWLLFINVESKTINSPGRVTDPRIRVVRLYLPLCFWNLPWQMFTKF